MAEFMKRTTLGGYKPVQGGYSDPECEYVLLTKREYDQILKEKAQAEQESRNTKYDADKKIKEIQRNADYRASEAAKEAREAIEGMEGELAAERAESALQRGLNANLLRIAKERANADRKLRPKKEHTGYVVVSSVQKEYRYRDRRSWITQTLWETVMQSPYTMDFTEAQVRRQIEEDLCGVQEDGSSLLGRIGIERISSEKYEDMISSKGWEADFKGRNVLLQPDQRFRANFRTQYWELIFLHTRPLGIVPQDMRAC